MGANTRHSPGRPQSFRMCLCHRVFRGGRQRSTNGYTPTTPRDPTNRRTWPPQQACSVAKPPNPTSPRPLLPPALTRTSALAAADDATGRQHSRPPIEMDARATFGWGWPTLNAHPCEESESDDPTLQTPRPPSSARADARHQPGSSSPAWSKITTSECSMGSPCFYFTPEHRPNPMRNFDARATCLPRRRSSAMTRPGK